MHLKNRVPLYRHTSGYARENGEMEQFFSSRKANIACKESIEQAIDENWDGLHIVEGGAHDVVNEYGAERVSCVLAATVLQKDWDKRISTDNRAWAQRPKV